MKPSFFANKHPWCSVFGTGEHETVAVNIMRILKRTGDVFRELTFDEYKAVRLEDGYFNDIEEHYFNDVIEYCKSSDAAQTFSASWEVKRKKK